MLLEIISWTAVLLSMISSYMLGYQDADLKRIFAVYIVANVLSITYFAATQQLQYTLLNIFFLLVSIRGLYNHW